MSDNYDDQESAPLLNYTPIFSKFVDANKALLNCIHAINPDELKTMSKSTMDTKCVKEKNDIKSILESNEMTMTQLVKDRVKVLYAINALGPVRVYERETIE